MGPTTKSRTGRGPQHGLTLVELLIGLAITSLVAAAVLAITLSVSAGWRATQSAQQQQVAAARTLRHVQQLIRESRLTGYWQPGSLETATATPALLLLWRQDLNGDSRIQTEEVALLEHVPGDQTLIVHEVSFASPAQRTANNLTWPDAWLYAAATANDFRGQSFVRPRMISRHVAGATLNVVNESDAVQRPAVEFRVRLDAVDETTQDQGPQRRYYGMATLRSPATRPAI